MAKSVWKTGVVLLLLLTGTAVGIIVPASTISADSGNFSTTSSDGCNYKAGGTFSERWSTTNADTVYSTDTWSSCRMSGISIYRSYLYFDTSSIPDLATITSATLYLSVYAIQTEAYWNGSGYEYWYSNITVTNGQPTYPHDPLQSDDYHYLHYSNTSGGSRNTSTMTYVDPNGLWNSISLNATGISWINKAGTSKFCLRTNRDIAGQDPGGNFSGIFFRTAEYSSAPYLSLTWEASANPTVSAFPATYITMSSVRMSGQLVSDGGEECDVGVMILPDAGDPLPCDCWLPGDCPWPMNDEKNLGKFHTGETFYYDYSGLCPGDNYEFSFHAANTFGDDWSNIEYFTSLGLCPNISNIHVNPLTCWVNLSWTKPCANTIIRYSTGLCPTDNTSGTEIYNGSSSFFSHTGLTPGTIYHYRFQGYDSGYWGNMSDCITVSTLAGSCEGDTPISSDTGDINWFLWTNSSHFDNIPIVSDVIYGIADGFSMPHNTAVFLFSIFFIVVSSFIWYLASHNMALCGAWVIIWLATFGFYQMLPLLMCIIFGLVALGAAIRGAIS